MTYWIKKNLNKIATGITFISFLIALTIGFHVSCVNNQGSNSSKVDVGSIIFAYMGEISMCVVNDGPASFDEFTSSLIKCTFEITTKEVIKNFPALMAQIEKYVSEFVNSIQGHEVRSLVKENGTDTNLLNTYLYKFQSYNTGEQRARIKNLHKSQYNKIN